METFYTHQRGFHYFMGMVGAAFEGRYPMKTSDVGMTAIEIMAKGQGMKSWILDKPREVPRHRLN